MVSTTTRICSVNLVPAFIVCFGVKVLKHVCLLFVSCVPVFKNQKVLHLTLIARKEES